MDVIKLERVQRQFKRVLLGLKYLSYKEKLDRLGTYSLLREKLRGDLIKVYKTIGLDNVESWSLFQTFFQKPHFSGQSSKTGRHRFMVSRGQLFSHGGCWICGTNCQRKL